jgi:hypothetical protein
MLACDFALECFAAKAREASKKVVSSSGWLDGRCAAGEQQRHENKNN